jgi:hypothetical protein
LAEVISFPKRKIKSEIPLSVITDPEDTFLSTRLEPIHAQILLDFIESKIDSDTLAEQSHLIEQRSFCLPGEGYEWFAEALNRLCTLAGDGPRW